MDVKTLKTLHYKIGYEVRTEEVIQMGFPPTIIRSAYLPNGDYLGDPKMAKFIMVKMGIKPSKADPKHAVCSIGFNYIKMKWYGWSHRAICGFGIGDKIFEEEFGDENTPLIEHGTRPIVTLDDAREAAIAFARSVS